MQSIMDDVYTITKRPDLVNQTQLAVAKATMKMHMTGLTDNRTNQPTPAFYTQDLVTEIIALPTQSDNHYQIDLTDYPLLRAVYSLKEYNNPLNGNEVSYTPKEKDAIFDGYNMEMYDYYYRAGAVINFRPLRVPTNVELTYYGFPNVDGANYNSWIANRFPHAIHEEAASSIFRQTGKDSEFKIYQAMTQENIAMLASFSITTSSE